MSEPTSYELISKLNPRQQAFVRAYVENGGKTAGAARAAGYKGDGQGTRKSCLHAIEAVYREAHVNLAPKVEATKEWLLDDFMRQATALLGDLYDDEGNLLPIKQWPEVWQQGLVSAVKTSFTSDGVEVLEVKLADRTAIRRLIGQHVGVKAFADVIELRKSLPVAEILSRRRALMEEDA